MRKRVFSPKPMYVVVVGVISAPSHIMPKRVDRLFICGLGLPGRPGPSLLPLGRPYGGRGMPGAPRGPGRPGSPGLDCPGPAPLGG